MAQQLGLLKELRSSIISEGFRAFGLSPAGWSRKLLEPIVWPPAHRFARLALSFDEKVARSGVSEASRWFVDRFAKKVEVFGTERVPLDGPLMVASNHPGVFDALLIAACLRRNDLKIIVQNIPFIQRLPHLQRCLIFAPPDPAGRMAALRSVIRHLDHGGSLLIFPSGRLDPDPAVLPGAFEALHSWSPSLALVLRKVPQTSFLVTIVSGVLAPVCLHHPLARLRKCTWERQKWAELVQGIQQLFYPKSFSLVPKISIGKPLPAADLAAGEGPPGVLLSIVEKAGLLLAAHTSTSRASLPDAF